jgi:hypothetical protein
MEYILNRPEVNRHALADKRITTIKMILFVPANAGLTPFFVSNSGFVNSIMIEGLKHHEKT